MFAFVHLLMTDMEDGIKFLLCLAFHTDRLDLWTSARVSCMSVVTLVCVCATHGIIFTGLYRPGHVEIG